MKQGGADELAALGVVGHAGLHVVHTSLPMAGPKTKTRRVAAGLGGPWGRGFVMPASVAGHKPVRLYKEASLRPAVWLKPPST